MHEKNSITSGPGGIKNVCFFVVTTKISKARILSDCWNYVLIDKSDFGFISNINLHPADRFNTSILSNGSIKIIREIKMGIETTTEVILI